MWRWIFGIFLILHGVTHVFWPTYGPSHSWLVGDAPSLAVTLWIAATALFAVAGVAFIAKWGWWPTWTMAAAIESLVLMVLFWSFGLWVGLAIKCCDPWLADLAATTHSRRNPRDGGVKGGTHAQL